MGEQQLSNLRSKFESLTQGNLTVRKYGEEFLRLSRYASDLVADPRRRRTRFIKGLHPVIASAIDSYPDNRIEFLMDKAEFHESLIGPRAAVRNVRLRTEGPSNTAPQPRPQASYAARPPSNQPRHQGGNCHVCGKSGHWARYCPQKVQSPDTYAAGHEGRGPDVRKLVRLHAVVGGETTAREETERTDYQDAGNATVIAGIAFALGITYELSIDIRSKSPFLTASFETVSSTNVFHCLQPGHCPIHLEDSYPHSLQKKTDVIFFM